MDPYLTVTGEICLIMATGSTGVAVGKECSHVMPDFTTTRFSNENSSPNCTGLPVLAFNALFLFGILASS